MEPLPATIEAFEKLDRVGFPDAEAVLQRLGRRALAEVPECVGLSLTLVEDGITLTLVSSSLDVARSMRCSTSTVVRAWRRSTTD